MKRFVAAILCMSFLTTGCATMFHGTTETVHVRSEESNTRFFVNERELGIGTSAVTTIDKRKLSSSTLRAEKVNCNSKTSPIATRFDAISLLDFFLDFGIVSFFIIDLGATGAVTQAAQTDYVLTPECATKSEVVHN